MAGLVRLRFEARGAVQGVGFRPFVFNLACRLELKGFVMNTPQGATAELEGPEEALQQFLADLESDLPNPAYLSGLETQWLDAAGYEGFVIRESTGSGGKSAVVLPDIATCPHCLSEVLDPENRRYRYPFTNCTHCGPRYSILLGLPYDRPNTSMRGFAMCRHCHAEYEDPADRRFHAQPNACPTCGPQLELWDPQGHAVAHGDRALIEAAARILEGKVVAVKGIGGFHLMVDARNDRAVRQLRERKKREAKPLAVMAPSLEAARELAWLDPAEERLLNSPEAPIVIALSRMGPIAPSVAPENPNLGIMLPYSPLHHLLMLEVGAPVVATSGNLSEEPICIDEKEALTRFAGIADWLLVHNRPIVRPIDDSVVRVMQGRAVPIRRARGYAPLPVPFDGAEAGTLAVGAHLKNSIAISIDGFAVLSPHIGDLDNVSTRKRLEEEAASLTKLYESKPRTVVHDLHTDYASSRYAESVPAQSVKVQHHVAHAVACIAENQIDEPALAVSWDGTGYGPDGTVWGGEFFLLDGRSIRRVAHLKPFLLPGGDVAVREGRRAALGLVFAGFGEEGLGWLGPWIHAMFEPQEIRGVLSMLRSGLHCVKTTSAGRLFDAAAALGAGVRESRFEGDAAMRFESLAYGEVGAAYPFFVTKRDGVFELDWSEAVKNLVRDAAQGAVPSKISARFHSGLAEAITEVAMRVGVEPVALTGGCFQNRRLLEETWTRLRAAGHRPYLHQRVPPNDGGIAFGQMVAAQRGIQLV